MWIAKAVVASALIFASPAALACDMDGYGGHRYFAFANIVGGPSPDQSVSAPRQNSSRLAETTALQPKQRNAQPADTQSTETADTGSTDAVSAPQTSSAEQVPVPGDGLSDGAVFR